jgi:hypothetical protein
MPTSLFAIDTDGRDRILTRVLLTAEGRGAAIRGVTTVQAGRTALLWLTHGNGAASDHLLQALRRPTGCLTVTAVPLVDERRPRKHRVHVGRGVVDVVLELEVGGVTVAAAGDGPTLMEATAGAVAACFGTTATASVCWFTAHPLTGRPVAVARTDRETVAASAGTPERACLAALLAVHEARSAQQPAVPAPG